jgi:hypothetical protein
MTTFACGGCGASLAFDGVRTALCPYCASPSFVERPPSAGRPDPDFVVTFVGDAAAARRALERWLRHRSLFASIFGAIRRARVEDMRGIYVPAYVYSAVAHTDYTASIGEHYSDTEDVTVTEPDGTKRKETRTVTRTEYRPLAGRHVGYVSDVVASASAGLSHAELDAVEPFDLRRMRRFKPALVTGWIAEEFARSHDDCLRASRAAAVDEIGTKLRRFMPGDSHADLAWRTQVSWESLDPIFVPVWVLALHYRDDKPPVRVVINGQTGKVAGRAPLSWWKVTLAIVLALAIAAIAWWLMR